MGNSSGTEFTQASIQKKVDAIRLDGTSGIKQVKSFLNIFQLVTNEMFVKFLQIGVRDLHAVAKITESQLEVVGIKSMEHQRIFFIGVEAVRNRLARPNTGVEVDDHPLDLRKFRAEVEKGSSEETTTAVTPRLPIPIPTDQPAYPRQPSPRTTPVGHHPPPIPAKKPLPSPRGQHQPHTTHTSPPVPHQPPPKPSHQPRNLNLPSVPTTSPVVASDNTQANLTPRTWQTARSSRLISNDVVGRSIANVAQNEEVQQKVGGQISSYMTDKANRQAVGKAIATNSDNPLVRAAAGNEFVQDQVGGAVASAASNRQAQKAVGNAVADAATNPETRQKIYNGAAAVGGFGANAVKTGIGFMN